MFEKLGPKQQLVDPDGKATPYFLSLFNKLMDQLSAHTARFTPSGPTGTTSTTAVMMGLGSAVTFTPNGSGNVEIVVCGALTNTTASDGATAQITYGTGTAPTNGAAATGTTAGNVGKTLVASNGQQIPFALTDIVSLSAGTTYWFDLKVAAVNGGTGAISSLILTFRELP